MPGFPTHQGAFFSAVENTLFLKQEGMAKTVGFAPSLQGRKSEKG